VVITYSEISHIRTPFGKLPVFSTLRYISLFLFQEHQGHGGFDKSVQDSCTIVFLFYITQTNLVIKITIIIVENIVMFDPIFLKFSPLRCLHTTCLLVLNQAIY